MRALPDGFELTFTQPIDKASAVDGSFKMDAYTYIYQKAYGSPEVDPVKPKVTVASVAEDGKSLKLKVEPLTKGHVHELHADGLKVAGRTRAFASAGLLHAERNPALRPGTSPAPDDASDTISSVSAVDTRPEGRVGVLLGLCLSRGRLVGTH